MLVYDVNMIDNISIPIVLNGRTCRIDVVRTLFSNDPDTITLVWIGDDNEEIEHCYSEDLSAVELLVVTKAIEEYDREAVKRNLL